MVLTPERLYSLRHPVSVEPDSAPPTIAGHAFALQDRASGMLNLRIALRGTSLAAFARALAKLGGVRVTGGHEGAAHARCYLVHCLGFKMVLSAPSEETADFALALVSRTPQAALAVMSDLGNILERLMNEPLQLFEPASAEARSVQRKSTPLRRSALQQGKPLARRTELRRKTPLARGRFR